MPGEQEHHICLYRFSFHKPIKSRLARGRLYLPFTIYNRTTESATLRPLNSGYQILIFTHLPCLKRTVAKINLET